MSVAVATTGCRYGEDEDHNLKQLGEKVTRIKRMQNVEMLLELGGATKEHKVTNYSEMNKMVLREDES